MNITLSYGLTSGGIYTYTWNTTFNNNNYN
jgi:hypothetical protein